MSYLSLSDITRKKDKTEIETTTTTAAAAATTTTPTETAEPIMETKKLISKTANSWCDDFLRRDRLEQTEFGKSHIEVCVIFFFFFFFFSFFFKSCSNLSPS